MLLRDESEGSKFKFLALDNDNDDHQGIITPQRGNAIDFLKFCRNVRIYKHRATLAALETYVLQSKLQNLHQSLREQLENGHTEFFFPLEFSFF